MVIIDNTEGFRAYQRYLAIKLHFTTDYDFFKYAGKSKSASVNAFEKRKDVFFFRKMERRYSDEELTDYFVANFVENTTGRWIGELASLHAEKVYDKWKKKIDSFSYMFREDMIKIKDYAPTNFLSTNVSDMWQVDELNSHPEVLRMYLGGHLNIESMVAANRVLGYIKIWDNTIAEDFIWPDVAKRLKKYDGFLKLDGKVIKSIMKEVFV